MVSFHSRQSLSVSFFHVSLGLPAPRLPSICISHAVLIAPLERSTFPNQRSLLSLKMRSRSSSSSFASNLLDLTVATSSGLILQICLIMALSCAASAAGSFWSVAKFHWHGAPHARAVYMATCLNSIFGLFIES